MRSLVSETSMPNRNWCRLKDVRKFSTSWARFSLGVKEVHFRVAPAGVPATEIPVKPVKASGDVGYSATRFLIQPARTLFSVVAPELVQLSLAKRTSSCRIGSPIRPPLGATASVAAMLGACQRDALASRVKVLPSLRR